jgi:hypothetical protein
MIHFFLLWFLPWYHGKIFSIGHFTVEDLEMNDGTAEKPYFMSKGLMNILGKKNLKPGEKKKCCGCC